MKKTAAAFLASILTAHSYAFAAEPEPPSPITSSVELHPFSPAALKRSVTVNRLGTPLTSAEGVQSAQPQTASKERHWCRRHPVLCGAAIGYPAGFSVGVFSAQNIDYDPSANGLFFGGPIGAAIGAGVGGIIGEIR